MSIQFSPRFLNFLLLWLIFQSGYGQFSLKIQVKDSATKVNLGYASIHFNQKTYISDEKGFWIKENLKTGRYQLDVHHVGCTPKSFEMIITKDTFIVILLPHHIHTFDEVITTEKSLNPSPAFRNYVVKNEQLIKKGATTLEGALEGINGVQFLKNGVGISKPIIQGMYGSRLAINLGDTKLESQQWGNDHAPEIDPLSYGNVQLIKGPSSLMYGGDGIGGLILLNQSKFSDSAYHDMSFLARTETNSGGLVGALRYETFSEVHKMGNRIVVSGMKHGDSRSPEYVLSNTGYDQVTVSYYGIKYFKKQQLEVMANFFHSNIGILAAGHLGNLTDLKRTFENGNPEIIEPFTYEIKEPRQQVTHLMTRAKYQYFFNERHKISVSYTFQKNNREEYDMGRLGNVFPSLDLQLITHQLLSSWEFHWKDIEMKYGIALDHQENTFLGRFFIPNYLRNKGGLFAIFEKTKLRYGWEFGFRTDMVTVQTFRPEHQNITKEDFNFRGNSLAFSTFFKWNEDVTSFLTVGSRFRMPDMNELFSGGLHHGVGALEFGDMTMKSERSYSISIPNIYNHNNLRVNVEPFYHHFNNYIYLVPTNERQLTVRGAFPVFRYQQSNVNYAGIDADMQYNLSGKWLMFLGGQFIYVKDRASNAFIYGIAPPSVRGRITYNKTSFLNLDQFFITTKANMVAFNRWVSIENDFAPPPDAYFLLGIELGGYLKNKPFFFSFGVNNLLNAQYRDYLNRYRYFADEQGINIVFTAKYQIRESKFKNFKNDK